MVMFAISRLNEFLDRVVEALVTKIAFLFRHPLLQAEVWLDDKFALCHVVISQKKRSVIRHALVLADAADSPVEGKPTVNRALSPIGPPLPSLADYGSFA